MQWVYNLYKDFWEEEVLVTLKDLHSLYVKFKSSSIFSPSTCLEGRGQIAPWKHFSKSHSLFRKVHLCVFYWCCFLVHLLWSAFINCRASWQTINQHLRRVCMIIHFFVLLLSSSIIHYGLWECFSLFSSIQRIIKKILGRLITN